ncbi:MAG: hypothetical protein N2171_08475 [Clostridia bacterium]|nr:hypothetical protein [Clostridia bacterium]
MKNDYNILKEATAVLENYIKRTESVSGLGYKLSGSGASKTRRAKESRINAVLLCLFCAAMIFIVLCITNIVLWLS